jgi:hypothetical protein
MTHKEFAGHYLQFSITAPLTEPPGGRPGGHSPRSCRLLGRFNQDMVPPWLLARFAGAARPGRAAGRRQKRIDRARARPSPEAVLTLNDPGISRAKLRAHPRNLNARQNDARLANSANRA